MSLLCCGHCGEGRILRLKINFFHGLSDHNNSAPSCVRHTFAPNHTPYPTRSVYHNSAPSSVRHTFAQPTMEGAATIIDLWRASARKRKARSRANEIDAKREAEKIMVRERMARSRAKQKVERRIRECVAKAGNGINLPMTMMMGTTGAPMATTPSATTTMTIGAAVRAAADGTTTMTRTKGTPAKTTGKTTTGMMVVPTPMTTMTTGKTGALEPMTPRATNAMNRAMNGGVMNGDSKYVTWKVMNSPPFKHWVNLENGQEFVYDSCKYLKPCYEVPFLKRMAAKERRNEKNRRAMAIGTTVDPPSSPEKEEAKTIAVDALMAIRGPNETTHNKTTVITVHVKVQGQRKVKSVKAIIMGGGDGGRYGGDDYADKADTTALLESCCYRDFLSHNHSLIKIAKETFDDLFCNQICTPWSEGNGIVISGDSCYGNPIKINIHRPSYLRQNYGLNSDTAVTFNIDAYRACYGTGGGMKTLGIPKRQVECLMHFSFR